MDPTVQSILNIFKKYSLQHDEIKIVLGFYSIQYTTTTNISNAINEAKQLLSTHHQNEWYITHKDNILLIELAVIFTKEIFNNLAKYDWSMKYVDRSISPILFTDYINDIEDDKLRLFTYEIAEHTMYINFPKTAQLFRAF